MKKFLLIIIIFFSCLASTNFSYAQGVAVNTDGSTADPSAMLDVKAANKGVLVPRMTQSVRDLISSPANGLLIYQTDNTPGFYYNAGAPATPSWISLKGDPGPQGIQGITGPQGPTGNIGAGYSNGTAAGQVYLTGTSPFSPQGPQTVTGDVTMSSSAVTNIATSGATGVTVGNHIASALGIATTGVTGGGNVVLATSPTLVTPSLGTPSTLVGTNISGTAANLTAGKVTTNANLTGDVTSVGNATTYNNVVPVAKGGTGTASPGLVAGTNVTVSGTWPNQTINATGGGASPMLPFTCITRNITNMSICVALNGAGTQGATEAANNLTYVPVACTISKYYISWAGTGNVATTLRVGTSLGTMANVALSCTTSGGTCVATTGTPISIPAGSYIDLGVSGATSTSSLYTYFGSN